MNMKAYMKPEVLLTTIELQKMIAISFDPEKEAAPDGEVLSRQDNSMSQSFSIWEEEEEDN